MSKKTQELLKENNRLLQEQNDLLRRNNKPAEPVLNGRDWVCSRCGNGCYYDGRMGDGPILMCSCDKNRHDYSSVGRD